MAEYGTSKAPIIQQPVNPSSLPGQQQQMMNPQGQPMMNPQGQPMMDAQGHPMMNPQGQPMMNQNQMMNPGYQQGVYGQQPYNPYPPFQYGFGGYPQPMLPPVPIGPPPPVQGSPLGLEYLIPLDRLFVKQQIELLEVFAGIETANRYEVLAGNGLRIYFASETSGCCAINCGGPRRPFTIDISDSFGRPVLNLERPCDCLLYLTNYLVCCCGSIGGSMVVSLPDGTALGGIVHVFNCGKPKYEIKDAKGATLFVINGPSCGDCCGCVALCGSADFPVVDETNGVEIGAIRKTFAGIQEFYTDADNFGVEFLADLPINAKALIFASVFLIDFMYFESTPDGGARRYRYQHHY